MTGSAKLRGVSALPESTAGKGTAEVAAAEPAKAAPAELHAPEGILTQEETIADSLLTFSGRAGQTLERHSQNTAKHRA